MAGNARRGPHCIGILFLCQEWRQWGLFFVGWSFVMKPMLPPIRQNVFLAAGRSPFLELLTLQKGPIVPFSATTPLFGRILRIAWRRAHVLVACRLSRVALRVSAVVCRLSLDAWCPPFVAWSLLPAAGLFALSLVARRPSAAVRCSMSGACHSVWPLPSACRRLRPLGSVARRLRPVAAPDARVFLPAFAPLRSRNAPRRSPTGVCYSLIAVCRISVVPPAALTPSKHTLHFAVTCVSRS